MAGMGPLLPPRDVLGIGAFASVANLLFSRERENLNLFGWVFSTREDRGLGGGGWRLLLVGPFLVFPLVNTFGGV